MTMLHFSPTLGAWSRCKAFDRPGPGVSFCPNFTENGGAHVAGMAGLAAQGGGQIHRNGRLTTVTPNTDGSFTARTGKLTRIYDADGKLLKLRSRLKDGWSAKERWDAENQAIQALVESGAYNPAQVSRLSGIASLDRLRRIDPIEWANLDPDAKRELITTAFKDTGKRFAVGDYDIDEFRSLKTIGQTTFYVTKDRLPLVTLSSDLLTTLSNRTATDSIARQIAHLIEGRNAAHGPAWQARVRELREALGLDIEGNPINEPHRKSLFEKDQTRLYARNSEFMATCPNGHTFYRRSLEDARGYCGDCYRESRNPNVALRWEKNPDAGKWVLTKNGLEKLTRPVESKPEPKATRGRKVTSWTRLPAIETKDDLARAMTKASEGVKRKLRGADYVAMNYPQGSRKSPIVNESELMWPHIIESGYALTDKDRARIDAFIATDEPEGSHFNHNIAARNETRQKVRLALRNYSPDPELIAYARELRERLTSDDEGGMK